MKIVFMGTADFGIPVLRALHAHHTVIGVVSRPDTRRGRGRELQSTPVKSAALELGLPVVQPESLKDPSFINVLRDWEADLFIVVAFRILPPDVFTIPPRGTINLHGSLLPDYRGAAPINHAVMNGDSITGVTTFFIDESVDTGDILLQKSCPIGPDDTAGDVYDRLMGLGADLVLETVNGIEAGTLSSTPQDMTIGRKAPKLFKEHGRIDWSRSAAEIHNQVRGLNPVPGAFTDWGRGPLRIRRTSVVDTASHGEPGSIAIASSSEGVVVQCGAGRLSLQEVQPPGKRPMDGASFVRGYHCRAGETLASGGND